MPSLGVSRSHWPVVAWIRLKLPVLPQSESLIAGIAPPAVPPLDILTRNVVATDPRKRVYAFEEEQEDWVLRLVWDADDPGILEAEYRAPFYGARLPREKVPLFWAAVKRRTEPLGPLSVISADPRP